MVGVNQIMELLVLSSMELFAAYSGCREVIDLRDTLRLATVRSVYQASTTSVHDNYT